MKITIEFTNVEKTSIMAASECTEDKAVKETGKFGSFYYSKKNNRMDFNLNETYIVSISCLLGRVTSMLKDFLNLWKSFSKDWFEDLEIEEFDEEEDNTSSLEN